MPDQEPIPPQPPPSGPELGPKSTSTDLPSNVAAALACIPLIGGIIFYVLEKHDSFVRFYAMQSIIFGIAWILISIGCYLVWGLLGAFPIDIIAVILQRLWNLIAWLIYVGLFVIVIVAVVRALGGVRWEIPYIGPIARKQMETAS
jgi:uncharacterized membrane protein